MMCVGVVRLEFDRSFVFAQGAGHIDVSKKEHFPERSVRFGEVRIELESFERCLFGFRTRLAPVRTTIKRGQNVSARKTGISQGIIWIARNRLLIKPDRLGNVVARPLSPKR